MRKSIIVVIAFILLALSGVGFVIHNAISKERALKINKNSILLAETLVGFHSGKDKLATLKEKGEKSISENVYIKVADYNSNLKSQNDTVFNLTEYYTSKGLDSTDDPVADELAAAGETELHLTYEDRLEAENGSTEEQEVIEYTPIEDDKRIYTEDGLDYIKVKDMDFTETGSDILAYKGIYLEVEKSLVPETYEMMLKNPNNIFKYVTHKKSIETSENFIDILFKSVNNGDTSKVIRVFNNGKRITDFEVK